MLNKTIIQGRMVREPEKRYTQSQKPVTSFTLAWSEKFGDSERKVFLPCVAWNKSADFVAAYFHKGQECMAEGKLVSRSWEDKDGNKRETVELIVESMHFCGPKQDEQPPYDNPRYSDMEEPDGELPF